MIYLNNKFRFFSPISIKKHFIGQKKREKCGKTIHIIISNALNKAENHLIILNLICKIDNHHPLFLNPDQSVYPLFMYKGWG